MQQNIYGLRAEGGSNPLENAYTFNFTTETAPTPKTFSDIQEHWAQKDIETMAGLGIVKGITEDTFGPELSVNRAQFATLLIRSLDIEEIKPDEAHFSDVPPSSWYYGPVKTAYAAGLISGYDDGSFRPEQPIKREEIAALIARALKKLGTK